MLRRQTHRSPHGVTDTSLTGPSMPPAFASPQAREQFIQGLAQLRLEAWAWKSSGMFGRRRVTWEEPIGVDRARWIVTQVERLMAAGGEKR